MATAGETNAVSGEDLVRLLGDTCNSGSSCRITGFVKASENENTVLFAAGGITSIGFAPRDGQSGATVFIPIPVAMIESGLIHEHTSAGIARATLSLRIPATPEAEVLAGLLRQLGDGALPLRSDGTLPLRIVALLVDLLQQAASGWPVPFGQQIARGDGALPLRNDDSRLPGDGALPLRIVALLLELLQQAGGDRLVPFGRRVGN